MAEGVKRKLQEILGILSVLSAGYLLLILLTHDKWDRSLFTYSSGKVHNLGGPVGAYISDLILYISGIASFIIPAGLTVFGVNRIMGRAKHRTNLAGVLLLILAVSIFCSLADSTFHLGFDSETIGIGGMIAARILKKLLSIPGAYVGALAFLVTGGVLLLPVSLESLVLKWRERSAAPARLPREKKRTEEDPRQEMKYEEIRVRPVITEPEPVKKSAASAAVPEFQRQSSGSYKFPPLDLLNSYQASLEKPDRDQLVRMSDLLKKSLDDFGITGTIPHVQSGPLVTMFEFEPDAGIKISKVVSLSDDLGRAMGGRAVRVARIPGKSAIGIEVPNNRRGTVSLREILSSQAFSRSGSKLYLAIGVDIYGKPYVSDLSRMPHLLVAGTTGSGKSVSLNSMIVSILYRSTPDEVKMLMIDPKMIELSGYEKIPHLVHPVITHPKEATEALKKMVFEMERRYRLIAEVGAKNIESYNSKVNEEMKLPYIIVILDELADLMYTASSEAEAAIVRLAQMARASGIHMIIATQRPSVDVITGIIKANFPTRIAFRVTSKIDSRTILDTNGAEQLLDRGDMLMLQPGAKQERLHGAYISEEEIQRVTDFIKAQRTPDFTLFDSLETEIAVRQQEEEAGEEKDDLYQNILSYAESMGEISISSIQRKFKIGYNRAARIMDLMEEDGLVGPPKGAGKPRSFIGKRNY